MPHRSALILSAAILAAPSAFAADMTVKDIITPEMIGAQIPFLESKVGPAFKVIGSDRIYKVGGCEVIVKAGEDNSIDGFTVDATEACSFDVAAFGADDLPPLKDMTFGDLAKATTELTFQADCLTLCGNAADPVVFGTWEGGRFNNLVAITVETKLVGDDALNAAEQWQKAMTAKEGEDYVVSTKFNCDGKYNQMAQDLFRGVRITGVTVGHVKVPASCDGSR